MKVKKKRTTREIIIDSFVILAAVWFLFMTERGFDNLEAYLIKTIN
jgi:cell division protein FtsB